VAMAAGVRWDGWAQTGAQLPGAVIGMLDRQDQNGDGFGGRGQRRLRQSGKAGGLWQPPGGFRGRNRKVALGISRWRAGWSWNCQKKRRGPDARIAQFSGGEAGGD